MGMFDYTCNVNRNASLPSAMNDKIDKEICLCDIKGTYKKGLFINKCGYINQRMC
jgi:hypothetical protein